MENILSENITAENISADNLTEDNLTEDKGGLSIEQGMLLRIAEELSALNRHLSDDSSSADAADIIEMPPAGRNSFLFSFELNGAATSEEYMRYFEFLETITSVLDEFGIHIGNNGYAYIMDAIKIIIDRETYDMRLKTDIYPLIAARYRLRNLDTVEHSIRNAIGSAYSDYLRNPDTNRMGIFRKKPTNKQFLIFAADAVMKCVYTSGARTAS